MDTKLYKGVRFNKESILDVQTHYKPTETFQYTNFYPCQPQSVKKGFIKGEAPYVSNQFRKSPGRKRLPCRYCGKVPL